MAISDSLKVWLPFNNSVTEDLAGNSWTAYGNPSISATNAKSGNALQLDGSSYLKLSNVRLGGQDFTIDCWFSATSNTTGGNVCLWQLFYSSSYRFHLSINTSGLLTLWKDSDSTVYIQSPNSVLDGQLHHAACVYHNSTWFFFLDGSLVGSKAHSFSARTYTLYVGFNYAASKYFSGSIDEFRIYNTALWTDNFSPPSASDYSLVSFSATFDAQRKISNPPLTWRYENFGSADLLSSSGTTLTDLPVTQSKTGSAFFQTSRAKCFDTPATYEIWIKFDVFTTLSQRWRAYNADSNGVCSYTNGTLAFWINSAVANELSGKVKNQLQTVLLHMVSGSSSGVVEAWIDGVKLYTYTGNVNNGNAFSAFFLQSDGNGTFFSNVIISNAEIGLNENVSDSTITIDFDAQRIVTTPPATLAHLTFDELEAGSQFSYYATPYVDDFGHYWDVPYSTAYIDSDTAFCGNSLKLDGNDGYLRRDSYFLLGGQDFTVDGWARIDSLSSNCYIASVGISFSSLGDFVFRYLDGNFVFSRWISTSDSHIITDLPTNFSIVGKWFYFAISYQYSTGLITLFINGVNAAHFNALIERNDLEVNFGSNLIGFLDDLRVVDGVALWYNPAHFNVDFDAHLSISNAHNFVELEFDSSRNIHCTVDFNVDTSRNISHRFIITPAVDGVFISDSADNTNIQSLQIDITPQQLTDQFSFSAVIDANILQQVKGQYIDYLFNLRIEKITTKGVLNTCLCCADIDELLYKQLAYKVQGTNGGLYTITLNNQVIASEKPKAHAHTHIARIARILGKNLVFLADNFISSADTEQGGITYNDLIRDIFGWSSRVPTKLINCYIRNDTLYVVQRGHEQNTIDISNSKHTLPTITKELFRTTWGSTPTSYTVTKKTTTYGDWEPILGNPIPDVSPSPGGDDDEPLPPEPDDTSRVLPHRVINDDSTVEYEYDDDGNVTKTTTTTDDGKTIVENSYETINGRKYLRKEKTTEYDWVNGEWVYIDSNTVYHTYLTQGQQNLTAIDSEGKIKGSLTTSARTDDRPTPFENSRYSKDFRDKYGYGIASDQMIDMWRALAIYTYVDGVKYEVLGFKKVKKTDDKELTINGIALYDSSFPIEDYNTLYALTAELRRLNRTTQETISLDVFDFPHIFDFNDKIIFHGNEYFLDSNSVSKTPRIVNKQSLKLVRWY